MRVAEFLAERNIPYELMTHADTFAAQRLAHCLHVPGDLVAKTVLLRADGGYRYIMAVLPATKRIDLKKLSHAFGESKLVLATEEEIQEHCKNCEAGALPPFGTQYYMKTIVDESLTNAEYIYFECETHHEAIRMKYEDFRKLEEPLVSSFAV